MQKQKAAKSPPNLAPFIAGVSLQEESLMKFWHLPILLLVIALLYSYWFAYTPAIIGLAYFLVSIVSYFLYAKDKKAAKIGAWRVSENTLHFSALFGGWPGALMAQKKLRHKTKKVSFRIVFVLTVLLNLGFMAYLHTPDGSRNLYSYTYQLEDRVVNNFAGNASVKAVLNLIGFRYTR